MSPLGTSEAEGSGGNPEGKGGSLCQSKFVAAILFPSFFSSNVPFGDERSGGVGEMSAGQRGKHPTRKKLLQTLLNTSHFPARTPEKEKYKHLLTENLFFLLFFFLPSLRGDAEGRGVNIPKNAEL